MRSRSDITSTATPTDDGYYLIKGSKIFIKRSGDGGATWSDHQLVGERVDLDVEALGIGPYDGKGWGNEALYTPRLTVIGDWYLVRQVLNFQESMRGVHEDATYGKQMAMMAKTVSKQELKDIAAFLNELAAKLATPLV